VAALTPAICRSALKTLLDSVTDIGKTYQQRKRFLNEAQLKTLAMATIGGHNVIRVWMIAPSLSNPLTTTRNPGHRGGQSTQTNDLITLQWRIEGYLSVADDQDSEQTAFDMGHAIADALNSYGLITGGSGLRAHAATGRRNGVQIRDVGRDGAVPCRGD
jgi:hypothetical protein